jgi:hypothetical protein
MHSVKHVGLVGVLFAVSFASQEVAAQARTGAAQRPATQRPAATAQRPAATPVTGSWELGMDMDFGIGLTDRKSFFIDIPAGLVRAGYFVSDVLSLEPALAFNSVAQQNQTGFSRWMLQLGALYHFAPDRAQMQMFVHPALGFSGGSGGARTATHLAFGVGVKQPMLDGRLATRLQVGLDHRVRSGPVASATSIIAFLGWSLYTN